MNRLYEVLVRASRETPDALAVAEVGGPRWSHAELASAAIGLAGRLEDDGVRAGDRVVAQLPTSAVALAVHLACVRLGALHVPLDLALTDGEVDDLVADAEPAAVLRPADAALLADVAHGAVVHGAVVHGAVVHGAVALGAVGLGANSSADTGEAVDRRLDDPAAILYTSGTTGRPKGVVLSQRNLVANAENLVGAWGFTARDVLVHALPLSHTHGLFVATYCALAGGGAVRLLPRFDVDELVRLLPESTAFMGVPTHYARLLEHPDFDGRATARMRLMTSGSAPLTAATHELIRQRTGQVVLERYGMTEACILTSNPLHGDRRAGTVGVPLPGVSLRLADPGDQPLVEPHLVGGVQVRGETLFSDYWRRPGLRAQELTADGWFRTGDLGRLDAAGYLELVARSKDLVISGGLNVYPKEVELVLDSLPGVRESAVVGAPDPDLGERVVAFVVPDGSTPLVPDEVRAAARASLAGFKVPKQVLVVDELPRTSLGKVAKNVLRASLDQPL